MIIRPKVDDPNAEGPTMLKMIQRYSLMLVCIFLISGGVRADDADLAQALDKIDAAGLLKHIQTLSSDEFEGRAPGSPGEEKSVAYLTDQFRRLGLKPGNPDGTYIQSVPLIGFSTKAKGTLRIGAKTISLNDPERWVAVSRRSPGPVDVLDSEVVFVGYGVVAPEYGWDDYKGLDVRGKTLVMLVNDPPVVDKNDPSKLDDNSFRGKAMTYYGRWTYKYEIGAEKGAAAVLIVHDTVPAGYPYEVVKGSWGRENFDIPSPDGNRGRAAIEGWIHLDTAKRLCELAGKDFDALKRLASKSDFKPIPLAARAEFHAEMPARKVASRNVVAKLEGSDPKLKNEYVVYTAHWDHLGRDTTLTGDQIYNGAADNASGVAALLEIAKALAALKEPPKRSILFLAVTAEEQGLLGSKYYATHPLYPLESTLADINMDGINLWGRAKDIQVVGKGLSTLEDLFENVAHAHERVVTPDAEPEKGIFYRSDHFEFAKLGVPAIYLKAGTDLIGKPAGFGKRKRDEYVKNDYHKVSDEVKPDWDLSGGVDDARLLAELGLNIASLDKYPEWKAGAEFKARREAMLKAKRGGRSDP